MSMILLSVAPFRFDCWRSRLVVIPVEFNRSFDHSRSNVESLSSNCLRLVHGLLPVQALEVPVVREPVSTNAFGGFRRLYCMKEVGMGCQALMDFRNAHGA